MRHWEMDPITRHGTRLVGPVYVGGPVVPLSRGVVGKVTDSLVVEYKFDESAEAQLVTDHSGNENHATIGSYADVDTNDPTPHGGYFQFSEDDHVLVQSVHLTYPFTVDFVVAFADPANANGAVIGTGHLAAIRFTQGSSLHFSHNPAAQYGVPVSAFEPGQFYQITAVYRSETDMSIYVDGQNVTAASDDYWTDNADFLEIGSTHNGSSHLSEGKFAYLMAYSKALSPAEVVQNHRYLKSLMNTRGIALVR